MKQRKTLTPEQKEAKRQVQADRVKAAVEAISSESGFRRWLEVATKGNLARFSFRNQLLVAVQSNGTATYCLTYKAWAALGRQVQKGTKALYVLRPILVTVEEEQDGQTVKRQKLVGWADLPEFDITQTDGEPVHTPNRELAGDEAAQYEAGLVEYAMTLGYTVAWEKLTTAGGYCNPVDKSIVVSTHNRDGEPRSGNEMVSTLIHEIAHAHDIDYQKFTRSDAEVIVELTAALVLMTAGLTDIDACAEYIACWCKGDAEMVQNRAALASKLAKTIEEAAGIETTVTAEEAA